MARDTGTASGMRRSVGRVATLLLIGGWGAVAAVSFLLDGLAGVRFLDLPLAAYLGVQGALVGFVVIADRALRDEDTPSS